MAAGDRGLSPVLDEPQSIETDALHPEATLLLANAEVRFTADAQSDLRDLEWPWAGGLYARSIRIDLTTYHGDPLVALVNRYYPGYQETILGSETLIISKRLAVPIKSSDDRALLWTFECQAEADLLVRFDVAIDWGEPLTQRIVDGLLVAQRNPGAGQGIYRQSNAESTRIFGNPHGPPESIALDDEAGTAHLVYYVLVNGIADVSLVLTLSDVGEQVAWNSFLALRDSERAFDLSNRAWEDALKVARIWTPDVSLNRAIQAGKLATLRERVHLRSGHAPGDWQTIHVPPLVDGFDTLEPVQSRNLLAHLRRVAERSDGRLPETLPRLPKEVPDDPGRALARTNGAYLGALHAHLGRHFDAALREEHFEAVRLCSERLIESRRDLLRAATVPELQALGAALRAAQALAALRRDGVNTVRWESEACEFEKQAEAQGGTRTAHPGEQDWGTLSNWHMAADRPWQFDDAWAGITLAAQAVWQGCGVSVERGALRVRPAWPAGWGWWALLGLPIGGGALSLVWDGSVLHSTQPVRAPVPVVVSETIRALHAGEYDFDLEFEFGAGEGRTRFHPHFA